MGYTNQGFDIKIQGLEQLRKKLDMLGKAGVKRAMRPALRAGQKAMTQATQAAAPVRTGLVQRNIKTRAMRRSRKHFGMRTVLGEGFYKGKTFYGAFQEFGWKTGPRKHDPSAVFNRYVRSLRMQSRAIRERTRGKQGLAKIGSEFREKQERYFREEANRRLVKFQETFQRRQIPGKHFMEKAAKANARAVGELIVKLAAPAIEAEAAKRG